jgi:hypothetical protein
VKKSKGFTTKSHALRFIVKMKGLVAQKIHRNLATIKPLPSMMGLEEKSNSVEICP